MTALGVQPAYRRSVVSDNRGVVSRASFPAIWTAVRCPGREGSLLIVGEPRRELLNSVLLAEMGLLASDRGPSVSLASRPLRPAHELQHPSPSVTAWMPCVWCHCLLGALDCLHYEP